jgi:choline dehydrogenase
MEYDDIIVGAGSCGCVLAARLSEDEGRRVLLLEAGPDYPTLDALPRELLDYRHVGSDDHDWHFSAEAVPGRQIAYPRGYVVGGSSAINGALALRGMPADYDGWARLGNDEWSWEKVLPYFRRLEADPDGDTDLHGRDGPLPIRRPAKHEWIPMQQAFFQACRAFEFTEVGDHNDPSATGVGPSPMNAPFGVRVSTAMAYLTPARHRANLTVRPSAPAGRVVFDRLRATGVELLDGEVLRGARVILAAGAIGSPVLLLRSGVGPAYDLARLGIAGVHDLPGVGATLIDHPQVGFNFAVKAGSLDPSAPMYQLMLRYTAAGSNEENDMQLCLWHYPESSSSRFSAILQKPRSRGRLMLASSDPAAAPVIELNFASEPEDSRRLEDGLQLAFDLLSSPPLEPFVGDALHWDDGVSVPLRDAGALIASDAARRDYVQRSVGTLYHPVGTARMGPPDDPGAVVDQYGNVRGVEALVVADASVMPEIPRANTNLTCIMIAERISDWLRA